MTNVKNIEFEVAGQRKIPGRYATGKSPMEAYANLLRLYGEQADEQAMAFVRRADKLWKMYGIQSTCAAYFTH